MTALATLTRTQIKVVLREPVAVGFGLVFPAVLLLVVGNVFPGATQVSPQLGDTSLVAIYAPTVAVLGLLTLGIAMLPQELGLNRERGILRRLAVTPAHPRLLVAAHLAVQAIAATIGTMGAVLAGILAFDLPIPQRPGWFLLAFVLSCAALLSIGALLGALVPTAQAGVGAGMLTYFPMMFFAGVYLPLEIMPAGLATFSARTPPGAAVHALGDAWAGVTPTATSLLVLVATTVVAGGLATRLFRWE